MNCFLKAALGILFSASLLGLSAQQSGGMGQGGQGGMGMGKGGMDSSSMCGMMMMHMMRPSYVFNTSDGGFVVFMGNRILKYDKELNLKKEVEIKPDSTGMSKMMQQCPMMKHGGGSDTTGHGSHH